MFEIIVSFWSVCVFFLEFSFEIAMEMMDLEIPMGSCAPWFVVMVVLVTIVFILGFHL